MNDLFDNKSIAVIGNAKSLFGTNYGKEIDSHDTVIRINKGIEVCSIPLFLNSHGKKVDIWCFNLYKPLENFDNELKKKIPQTYKRMQMNYSPLTGKFDATIGKTDLNEILYIFAPKKITTGFRILHYISKFNPKSVDIYGFDWKATPTYYSNSASKADLDHDYKKEKEYCFENYFKTGKYTLKS